MEEEPVSMPSSLELAVVLLLLLASCREAGECGRQPAAAERSSSACRRFTSPDEREEASAPLLPAGQEDEPPEKEALEKPASSGKY